MTLKIIKFYRKYFKPRFFYIQRYLDKLEFSSKNSKKVKTNVEELKNNASIELKAVKRLHIISIILYVALYFSIVNYFLSDFQIIGKFTDIITSIITYIGTPIFIGAQVFVTRLKNIRLEKLSLYTSHLISYSIKD